MEFSWLLTWELLWIAPANLEDVLATHPAILDATVTGDWKIGKLYK
ncbi:hypothetical protein HanPI659440_Chr14g0547921 [Helianthus annuus]|nr:hypothetical protein HanPI659440_Chr14g0547921 [Helianthus annuus]